MKLQNKVAFITGGTRGIGRAIAIKLAEEGAEVVINYLRKKSAAEELEDLAKSASYKFHFIKGNIEHEDEINRICDEIEGKYGRMDILVSNAVFGVVKPVGEMKRKFWDKTVSTNASSLLTLVGRMTKMPEFNGGSVIAMTSLGGRRVLRDYSVIGASKAALEALVRYIAVEFGPKGLRANAVSPGIVDTDALNFFPEKDEMVNDALDKTPLGRLTKPEDVAKLAAFLCSDDAYMITGEVINIDGGYNLWG